MTEKEYKELLDKLAAEHIVVLDRSRQPYTWAHYQINEKIAGNTYICLRGYLSSEHKNGEPDSGDLKISEYFTKQPKESDPIKNIFDYLYYTWKEGKDISIHDITMKDAEALLRAMHKQICETDTEYSKKKLVNMIRNI